MDLWDMKYFCTYLGRNTCGEGVANVLRQNLHCNILTFDYNATAELVGIPLLVFNTFSGIPIYLQTDRTH